MSADNQQLVTADAGSIEVCERGIELTTLKDVTNFARILLGSGLCPPSYKSVQAVIVAIMHGRELGLRPAQAVQAIAIINGRPCLWGDTMLGMILSHPQCEYVHESIEGAGDAAVATCVIKRRNSPHETVRSFSYANAKRADLLGKGPWKQYPERMLQMRARSWAIRDAFADVLSGLQVAEEVRDYSTPPATGAPRSVIKRSSIEAKLLAAEEADPIAEEAQQPAAAAASDDSGELF